MIDEIRNIVLYKYTKLSPEELVAADTANPADAPFATGLRLECVADGLLESAQRNILRIKGREAGTCYEVLLES